MEVRCETTINAPQEVVWKILRDADDWPKWNPVLHGLQGDIRPGGKGKLLAKVGNGPVLPIGIEFVQVEAPKELRWRGGIRGGMLGEHYFELVPVGDGATRLIHGERFTGVLAKLVGPLLSGRLQSLYEEMNAELKRRAEAAA